LLEEEERKAAAKAARKSQRKQKKEGKQGTIPPPEEAPASPLEEPSETPDDTQVRCLSISPSCNGRVPEVEKGECCHEDIRKYHISCSSLGTSEDRHSAHVGD
jgi:hypothetical protein